MTAAQVVVVDVAAIATLVGGTFAIIHMTMRFKLDVADRVTSELKRVQDELDEMRLELDECRKALRLDGKKDAR